ncbi:hypothetical protein E2C06_33515, partial [Dankookia rubra]
MISGANSGRGGPALGKHLAKAAKNESIRVLPARHLGSESIRDQIEELTDRAAHASSARTIYHVHIDPPFGWDDRDEVYEDFLERFEREFGLEDHARAGVEHVKTGEAGQRHHRHYAWDLARDDGSVIRLSHDYARRERCAVETAHRFGMPCPPLAHAKSVHAALRKMGATDVAAFVQASGELERDRRAASTTPRERLIEERTGVPLAEVRAAAYQAWQSSDNGAALKAALAERGLILAQGTKAAVVIDRAGTTHRLTGVVSGGAKLAGATVKAAEVHSRLAGLDLPIYTEAKARIRDAVPAQPATKAPDVTLLTPRQERAAARAAARTAARESGRQGRDTSRAKTQEAREAAELDAMVFPTPDEIAEAARRLEQERTPAAEPVAPQPPPPPQPAPQPRPAIEAIGAQGNPMVVEPPPLGSDFSAPVSEAIRLLHPHAVGHQPQPAAAPARPAPAQPQPAQPQQPRPQAARTGDKGDSKGSAGQSGKGAAGAVAPPRPRRPVAQPKPVQPAPEPQTAGLWARLTDWARGKQRSAKPPASAPRPQPQPAPTATPNNNLDPLALWDSRAARTMEFGHGRAPMPTWEAAPRTKEPPSHVPEASILLMRRPGPPAEEDYARRRWTQKLRNAGHANPAAAAAELVALRRGTAARAYNAATPTNFADPATRAEQLRQLRERAAKVREELRAADAMPTTVKAVDQLWLEHCRRHHADVIAKTERDIDSARQYRADAERSGDDKGVRRWDSALSILANEQHRFLCSLRAKDGGAEWRAIYADAAAAP